MHLLDLLQQRINEEQSPFRAQLLREDVARLKRLQDLALTAANLEAFKRAGMRVGWTQGDARTKELCPQLEDFLEALYAWATQPGSADETAIERAWYELHRVRMERLVGCLSTPVPKPDE